MIAVEDVARYRDALGVPLPPGLPEALLEPVRDPAGDLALRYARSHAPFTVRELAARYGLGAAVAEGAAAPPHRVGQADRRRVPAGRHRARVGRCRTSCAASAAGRSPGCARRSSRSTPTALGRFAVSWHGVGSGRHGLEALLDAHRAAAGRRDSGVGARARDPAGARRRLPPRHARHADGCRRGRLGGRRTTRRAGRAHRVVPDGPSPAAAATGEYGRAGGRKGALRTSCRTCASMARRSSRPFTRAPARAFPTRRWTPSGISSGRASSPTTPCTRFAHMSARRISAPHAGTAARRRSARAASCPGPAKAAGRWSSRRRSPSPPQPSGAQRWRSSCSPGTASITRETVASEAVAGGFTAVYQVLRAMEEAGRIRRGYFVAGLGAAQFALPAALDLLRSLRDLPEAPRTVVLAATDPANPYGSILPWPRRARGRRGARSDAVRRRPRDSRRRSGGRLPAPRRARAAPFPSRLRTASIPGRPRGGAHAAASRRRRAKRGGAAC